jgi:outer membrane protein insertion porin family
VGGDTQLLANFEYRVPLIGPTSLAAFADIGTAFNLRKGRDQTFSTNFLADQPYLSTLGFIQCRDSVAATSLSSLAACASGSNLAFLPGTGGLVARDNRLVTQEELDNAERIAGVDATTGLPFGFQQVFLRGEAQTNTVVRVPQSVFSKISDYRSSLGVEFRIQLPVVNVPFRLIYAFNPNARRGLSNELPGVFFGEKKSVFRFSIGRTF